MNKRTAIVDIGSNSARVVIFEKTSQFGFHLIYEQKSKVRIGEGAYEKNGLLQPIGLKRAFSALRSFSNIIKKYQANNSICVATSALRDAPNGKIFVQWIKKELDLHIKIIDGKEEAKYGAIAAMNLLPIESGITIDIGGGSSDLALIENYTIVDTYSLNLGSVRLKELFFDKNDSLEKANKKAREYIRNELSKLPKHFKHTQAIGIGGTIRSLSKNIMKEQNYPLDKLHAFTYKLSEHKKFLEKVPLSSTKNLKKYSFKKSRHDTIREGTLIFNELTKHLNAQKIITSSAGVREGVFLNQFLKESNLLFPQENNPSIESILDRFKPIITIEKKRKLKIKIAEKLYSELQKEIDDQEVHSKELHYALKLSNIGKTLTIYKSHQHAFYIAMQELNYRFTHEQIMLIAFLLRISNKDIFNEKIFLDFKPLLPRKKELQWLSFIYTLSVLIHEASNNAKIAFQYKNKTLTIHSSESLYLVKEKIKSLEKPKAFIIIIKDKEKLPKHKELGI